jgi:hypothetical protein
MVEKDIRGSSGSSGPSWGCVRGLCSVVGMSGVKPRQSRETTWLVADDGEEKAGHREVALYILSSINSKVESTRTIDPVVGNALLSFDPESFAEFQRTRVIHPYSQIPTSFQTCSQTVSSNGMICERRTDQSGCDETVNSTITSAFIDSRTPTNKSDLLNI